MAQLLGTERIRTDVLVIGGGVAALRAAIAAREAGADVVLCCKGIAGRSGNTVVSTADISAFVPELSDDDSPAGFAEDTDASGAQVGDAELIGILAERSGRAVLDLERFGVHLLRDGNQIDRTRAAGHSRARTYRADSAGLGPNKGLALSVPLADAAERLGVRIRDFAPIVRFSVRRGALVGAWAVDAQEERILQIGCGAIVLAAGGAGHLFSRTNSTGDATGDAVALALRAGALGRDFEFVQWHPTRMDRPVSMFLTNGLLADGAVFRDADGREFMAGYDPRANLAPRDVLAKAVYTEIAAGRGRDGGVFLDCSAIPADRVALRHAYLAGTLAKHGVDFPREPLLVSPATHFCMGGIAMDAHAASSLPGLFVAGESAGGIHGANRLGGNALCEGLVFGTIAGEEAAAFAAEHGRPDLARGEDLDVAGLVEPETLDPRPAIHELWQMLRPMMWEGASIVRTGDGLAGAAALATAVGKAAAALRSPTPSGVARILELRAAADCALAIARAAELRTESRGAHWRADFPETDPDWFGSIWVDWSRGEPEPTLIFHPKESSRLPLEKPRAEGVTP